MVLHPSTKAREMIAVALDRGSHRFEWLAQRQDHTEFPAEVLLTAIPFKERKVLHAVWRDITRRREAEQELSKSREALLSQSRSAQLDSPPPSATRLSSPTEITGS